MRRRLLTSTLAIAFVCMVILGVPLIIVARHQVWTSARDRLGEQAASIGTGLEDRIDAGQPVDLHRYLPLMPDRRLVLTPVRGTPVVAGPSLVGPVMRASVEVSDDTITVEASQAPTIRRAREVTLLVIGLALLAACAAIGLALWQARRVARPVADLVARADALGRGAFTAAPLDSDVPEVDRISHVLERSARQIGTLVDLQQQFASDAAHQLRTPLTSIGLHLDEIAQIGDQAVQDEADDALAQVERLDGVITSLLARARGDSADPVLVDLGALAAEGSAAWERLLARENRRLVRNLEDGVTVVARREHLLGVLASLLDNAVAHGDGDVRLTVSVVSGRALLQVRDSGAGVPAELTSSIFERRVSGAKGTGIGLALARSLAAAESGSLIISPACASEFTLTLPVAAAAARDH